MEIKKKIFSFMRFALDEAQLCALRGEVPVGAVLVLNNTIVARAGNKMQENQDPTEHAEMRVLKKATKILKQNRLLQADLYVTLEPCTMCAAAISFARIRRLYFGAIDQKAGAVESGIQFFNSFSCHHKPDVYGGIEETECAKILKNFFKEKR